MSWPNTRQHLPRNSHNSRQLFLVEKGECTASTKGRQAYKYLVEPVLVMTSHLSKFVYISRASTVVRTAMAAAVLALLFVACSTAQSDVPKYDQRAQGLNKTIMCPICPGESIDQSQATISLQMREIVGEKLNDGWSDDQIRDFFVDRYGPSVLMEPPTEGFSIMAWIVPPVIVATAIAAFLLAIRWMRQPGRHERQAERRGDTVYQADLERYYERIEAALEPPLTGASIASSDNVTDDTGNKEEHHG